MPECRAITVMDRVIAFLKLFDNDCKGCLRRSSYTCGNCRATTAKSILAEIKAQQKQVDETSDRDLSLYVRMSIIMNRLNAAGRPLRSEEIVLSSAVSPQLKAWTLVRMVRKGKIDRRLECGHYVYFINENKDNK